MNQLYHIVNFWPQEGMSGCGFGIKLYPEWKKAVAASGLSQESMDSLIKMHGASWLDGYGYDDPFEYEGKVTRLYEPSHCLQISWGEWGTEHITVPGDACGLDLCNSIMSPKCGGFLSPHNVDSIRQAGLLLTIFLFIADTLILRSDKTWV